MKTLLALVLTLSLTSAFATPRDEQVGSTSTVGSARGTFASESAPLNDSNPNTDTVGTGQSSTMRDVTSKDKMSCVDRAGYTYVSTDAGYAACRRAMRR